VKRAGLAKQLFTSATELAEIETARQKWLMFQSRLDAWRATLGALQALVRDGSASLIGWPMICVRLGRCHAPYRRGCGAGAPASSSADSDTNTYYDLETGAVNEEMLSTYIR